MPNSFATALLPFAKIAEMAFAIAETMQMMVDNIHYSDILDSLSEQGNKL